MKQIIFFIILALPVTNAFAQIKISKIKDAIVNTSSSLSAEEAGAGLKEALTNGASKGSDLVARADGYFGNAEIKIPFPAEIKQVETRLRQVGMGAEVDKFVLALNRAAEDAAQQAKPIFISAIKQMTIQDAFAVLKGEQDAATQYLKRTTTTQLTDSFKPVIQNSLSKVNATQYYKNLVTVYNKLPLVKKVNPDLDDYATQKALDGLFVMVAKEEKSIRQNPQARTSALLQKVFGKQ